MKKRGVCHTSRQRKAKIYGSTLVEVYEKALTDRGVSDHLEGEYLDSIKGYLSPQAGCGKANGGFFALYSVRLRGPDFHQRISEHPLESRHGKRLAVVTLAFTCFLHPEIYLRKDFRSLSGQHSNCLRVSSGV